MNKKKYVSPVAKVHTVHPAVIIATSGLRATSIPNEGDDDGDGVCESKKRSFWYDGL